MKRLSQCSLSATTGYPENSSFVRWNDKTYNCLCFLSLYILVLGKREKKDISCCCHFRKYLKFCVALFNNKHRANKKARNEKWLQNFIIKMNIFHAMRTERWEKTGKCLILIDGIQDVPITNLAEKMWWNYRKHQYFYIFFKLCVAARDVETIEIFE